MLRHTLAALALLAAPAAADPAIDALIEEFNGAAAPIYAAYDHDFAPATLAAAFERHGSSDYYLASWSGWIFVDFSNSRDWYGTSLRRLRHWNMAVDRGDMTQAEAVAVLRPAMDRALRLLDVHDAALARLTEAYAMRGVHLDRARAIGCCSPSYYHHYEAADTAMSRGRMPAILYDLPSPIPEVGGTAAETAAASEAILTRFGERDPEARPLWRDGPALHAASIELDLAGVPQDDPVAIALRHIAERGRLAELAPDALLAEAMELPENSGLRAVLLAEADRALEEQAAQMLFETAHHATASGEVDHAGLARAAELAIGLNFLRQRLENPTSIAPPSAGVRLYHAARAGLEMIEATGEAPEAHEWRRMTIDLARATQGQGVPVTSAFAVPAGAVAGQVQVTSDAFQDAAEAMNGVADAIGGDPNGIARAEAAAARLQERLNPVNIVRSMVAGAAEGFVSIVPGGREILGAIFG